MSEYFVAAPESPDGTQTKGIRASGNENFVIYRNQDKPSIVIDKKTGNIDIRAEDGTSFLKIDAKNKKLYIGDWDILDTKEIQKQILLKLDNLERKLDLLSVVEDCGDMRDVLDISKKTHTTLERLYKRADDALPQPKNDSQEKPERRDWEPIIGRRK